MIQSRIWMRRTSLIRKKMMKRKNLPQSNLKIFKLSSKNIWTSLEIFFGPFFTCLTYCQDVFLGLVYFYITLQLNIKKFEFVNIQIFHTFPRVLWDIVATSCMLPYKCHTYLESLWSLLFVGISQHDAMFIKIEENWVWSPKADFFNFLTVSDIF